MKLCEFISVEDQSWLLHSIYNHYLVHELAIIMRFIKLCYPSYFYHYKLSESGTKGIETWPEHCKKHSLERERLYDGGVY